jgi:hypothetical protein
MQRVGETRAQGPVWRVLQVTQWVGPGRKTHTWPPRGALLGLLAGTEPKIWRVAP